MPNTSVSLSEFAAADSAKKTRCKICLLPDDVRREVREAEGKISGSVVARWLRDVHALDLHNSGAQVRTCWAQHT